MMREVLKMILSGREGERPRNFIVSRCLVFIFSSLIGYKPEKGVAKTNISKVGFDTGGEVRIG